MTDPTDDTQLHPAADPGDPGDPAGAQRAERRDPSPTPDQATEPPAASEPPLRADPDRPADSGWREPAWFPPREGDRDRRPSMAAIVIGLILIAVGVWFFLDRTLGVDLPRIQWSNVWPVILIVIGGLILVRSFQRKA